MKGNPYAEFIKLMQSHGSKYNPPGIEIAAVTSIEPLTIQVGDLQLDKDDLLIADYLLKDYTREIELSNSANIQGQLKFVDTLRIGDMLAAISTLDEQTYIILARVVKLNE